MLQTALQSEFRNVFFNLRLDIGMYYVPTHIRILMKDTSCVLRGFEAVFKIEKIFLAIHILWLSCCGILPPQYF